MENSQFLEITSDEFSEFVETRNDVHFQQTKAFGELQVALGHQAFYFAVKNKASVSAAMLVTLAKVKFGYLAEAHGNPYFSDDRQLNQQLITGIRKQLKPKGVLKLVIHSNLVQQQFDDNWEKTGEFNQGLTGFYKDLGFSKAQLSEFEKGFNYNYNKELTGFSDLAKLKKSYNKNAQRSIKKAQRLGVKICEATYDELSNFKKVIDEAGERRHFSTRDLAYYEAVYKTYGDRVKFILAKLNFNSELIANQIELDNIQAEIKQAQEQNKLKSLDSLGQRVSRLEKLHAELAHFVNIYGDQEVILSAAQFFIMPNEVIYMFSGMYDEFREFSAPFLIQDYMLKYAYEHHITQYQFMGVNAPENPDQGVLKFKQNFKGYIWQSSGNYELMIKPFLNKMITVLKKLTTR